MRTATMGKVIVTAKLENLEDLFAAQRGTLSADQVRGVEVADARVDTACTHLGLTRRLITQLGLTPARAVQARSAGGTVITQVYQAVRLTIQGRDCTCDVMELPDDMFVRIGRVPLLQLDLVVDAIGQLVGNGEHEGRLISRPTG